MYDDNDEEDLSEDDLGKLVNDDYDSFCDGKDGYSSDYTPRLEVNALTQNQEEIHKSDTHVFDRSCHELYRSFSLRISDDLQYSFYYLLDSSAAYISCTDKSAQDITLSAYLQRNISGVFISIEKVW